MKISVRIDYLFEKASIEDQIKMAKDGEAVALETGQLLDFDCRKAAKIAEKNDIPFIACGFYDMWAARIGLPFDEIEFNLKKTIECAKILGSNMLLALTNDNEQRNEAEKKIFIENMKPVVELCEKNNMILVLEPHNTLLKNPVYDFSKYYLNTTSLGYEIIKLLGSSSVKLLFDFYHVQIMEGNILNNIKNNFDNIIHYHISGVPKRDEPWVGELNYKNIISELDLYGYKGYLGLEYCPTYSGQKSLADSIKYLNSEQ